MKNKNFDVKWYAWIIFGLLVILPLIFYKKILFLALIANKYVPAIFVVIIIFMILLPIFSMVRLIKYKDKKEFEKDIKLYLGFITILLIFLQVLILSNQSDIMKNQRDISNKQTEILDRTSQSKQADLLLVSSQAYQKYKFSDISKNKKLLAVGIINTGKSIAPYIRVEIESDLFSWNKKEDFDGDSPFWNLKELSSSGYNSTFFEIRINPNEIDTFNLGINKIIFKITCPYCTNQTSFQSLQICIYNQSSKEDCEGWR